MDSIVITIIVSLISSIIGGFIVIIYLKFKDRQKWKKLKEYLYKDWIRLLHLSYLGLRVLLNVKSDEVFGSSFYDETKELTPLELAIAALKKISSFFKKEIIPNFHAKYGKAVLEWGSKEWRELYDNYVNLISEANNLISRLISFSEQIDPKLLEQIFLWREKTIGIINHYIVFFPELEKPFSESTSKDKQMKTITSKFIEELIIFLINIAEEEIKSAK